MNQFGEMNRRINVCVAEETRDEAGQSVPKWKRIHRKWPAAFAETSGGETVRGVKLEATTTAVFDIRYVKDGTITEKHCIELLQDVAVVEGSSTERWRRFSIVSVRDMKGDRKFLTVQATEVK